MTNVIDLGVQAEIPEIKNRRGEVILRFGYDDGDSVEVSGSITLSEVCFLQKMLDRYILDQINDIT